MKPRFMPAGDPSPGPSAPVSDRHVAVLDQVATSLPSLVERLEGAGVPVEICEGGTDATVLVVGGLEFGDGHFAAAPNLELLVRAGIGLDRIDLTAAESRGVIVRNTPGYGTQEVADHALMLMLTCVRQLELQRRQARQPWLQATTSGVPRLADSTVGIVGLGAIGTAFARRARALGCTVIASDPFVDSETAARAGVELLPLDTLLAASDVISLHAPLTEQTHHLVDDTTLHRTRRRPVLVNTARGGLVDTAALLTALDDDRLGAAGLDVVDGEPEPDLAGLLDHDRVVVTPHVAWYSEGARRQLGELAADLAIEHLRGARAGARR